jgi:flavin-dependent dehydrogenase
VTALNLAPFRRVLLVERRAEPTERIGESLVPAARRLLADMGLLASFLAEGHEPWHANRSVWGNPEPRETDFLRNPDGHGWHLDRSRFEQWLRDAARLRGAELLCPATLTQVNHDGQRWRAELKTVTGRLEVTADLLVDAGGRASALARQLGARPQVFDRLVCAWVYGRDEGATERGVTYVEAAADGWWYTAPLLRGRRVLAFHTDADLPSARDVRERAGLLRRAGVAKELAALLAGVGFVPETECSITAAHSAILEPCARANWLAVGDAAISFDPLSSQGLLQALFSGLAAAEAAERQLSGDVLGIAEYIQTMHGIASAYRQHLAGYYAAETRWAEAPFWRRRQATMNLN